MRCRSVAVSVTFFLSLLTTLAAETDSVAGALHLQEVEVLSHATQIHSQAYRPVAEVTQAEIATMPATTLEDVLQTVAGVDIRTRGANGAQADISMRGGTFDQVTVMLNGVNTNDAQTGHYALNLPVPLSAVGRIEVLDGIINIVTMQPEEDTYDVSMQLGMNMFANAGFTGGWKRNEWRFVASGEYGHNKGYYAPKPSEKEQTALSNSDLDIANIYFNASWKGLDLQVGAQYKDAGAGSFYGFGSQDQFDATRTGFGAVKWKMDLGRWGIDLQAAYRANYDRYEWHRGKVSNRHFTQNATGTAKAYYNSSIGKTTFGVEVRNEHIHSTNFGTHNRLNVNYFAQQTFHVEGFSTTLAASGIYNTKFGNHWTVGADLGYSFPCGVTVYANANRSLRMPTFTDLYYDAGNQLGSSDLKPEKSWTTSVGGTYRQSFEKGGTIFVGADLYYRWGRDIIDWVYVAADTKRPYHAANQQKVNTLGVECSVQYKLNEWLRKVQVSYAYTLLDINLEEANSRYLDYLRHKVVVSLEHGIYKGLGASWTFSFRERQGQFNDTEGAVQDFQPVCLLDGEVFYEYKQWRVAIECTNITNRHYYDYGGILQPGAWARAHLRVRL